MCARSPSCVRAAPAYSACRQGTVWSQNMKQSTIGKFFAKPAASQSAAKPLTPSNAAREVAPQAKGVKSPEKKRTREGQVKFWQSKDGIQVYLTGLTIFRIAHWSEGEKQRYTSDTFHDAGSSKGPR